MALGGLLILAGLAILTGLTPTPSNDRVRDYIAAGLVAAGIPFLVFGDGPEAFTTLRSFLPWKGRRSQGVPRVEEDIR